MVNLLQCWKKDRVGGLGDVELVLKGIKRTLVLCMNWVAAIGGIG